MNRYLDLEEIYNLDGDLASKAVSRFTCHRTPRRKRGMEGLMTRAASYIARLFRELIRAPKSFGAATQTGFMAWTCVHSLVIRFFRAKK
jgi:hypothetical protein